MKGCRWMIYHLTVHTMIMHINKKIKNLTKMYLNSVQKVTTSVLKL